MEEDILKQLRETKNKLHQLEEQLEVERLGAYQERTKPLREVAYLLHESLCGYNHTDGCSWGYEEKKSDEETWTGSAHRHWLERVEALLRQHSHIKSDHLIEFARDFAQLRKKYPFFRTIIGVMWKIGND